MTRTEPAELFFGDDFYGDEHVLRMSYEEQGVYRRLLWISRRNGGLPDDPVAIAELLQLPLRGLTVKRFLAKVWPRIRPCWTSVDGGRLVQLRQESELERRAAARGVAPDAAAPPRAGSAASGGHGDASAAAKQEWKSKLGRHAANARWHGSASMRNADPHHADDADAHAVRNASASPSPHPSPVQVQENQPQARDADPHRSAHPHADAYGASAESESPEERGRDEVVQVQAALMRTEIRSGVSPFQRRASLLWMAKNLVEQGVDAELIDQAWKIAQDRGDEPGGLLSHWIDGGVGALRAVIDEQRVKRREAAARAAAGAEAMSMAGAQ